MALPDGVIGSYVESDKVTGKGGEGGEGGRLLITFHGQ